MQKALENWPRRLLIMAKKKENLLRQFAKDSFDPITEEKETVDKQKKGIREGTKGISGARIIDLERIKSDPDQPRKTWDKKKLNELAVSIEKHGVLQPITVEYIEEEDYFKVINGERRYRASKIAGLEEIPCIIRNIDQKIKLIHQLIENIQRQDLPPIELFSKGGFPGFRPSKKLCQRNVDFSGKAMKKISVHFITRSKKVI